MDGALHEEEVLPRDFGKYRLTRRIAVGGMAEIFLAHRHDSPLEPIVIKRILPHLVQSESFVSMFLDEARIAAGLDHPNIVRIEDIGQVEGRYFLGMEYIHGEDIRCIYNRAYKLQRSLPLALSIQVVADAARGLAHAHRATDLAGKPLELVHRDVSPQNLLVTYDGHVKVVDFGIAKAAGKVAQTRVGVLKGKYSYMSPEQALGESIDRRTDLFALGIILYETTTGTRLFKRQNELATLQAIIKCDYTRPAQVLPGYPPELEEVIVRALQRDPENRYQDGDVLADDLERFLEGSRLLTPRAAIASFMADLFADKLAEEEGSGEPAVPDAEAVKEELGGAVPARVAQARVPTELATRKRKVLAEAEGFAGDRPDRESTQADDTTRVDADAAPPSAEPRREGPPDPTESPWDAPDVVPEAAPEGSSPVAPPAPDGVLARAHPVEPGLSTEATDPEQRGAEAPAGALHEDEAATVAVEAWRPPGAPAPKVRRGPVREVHAEPTERIRARARRRSPTPWPVPSRAPKPPADAPTDRRTLVLAAIVVVLLGILIGALAVVIDRGSGGTAPAATPLPLATVTVITEPGADVFVDGDPIGEAGVGGRAGPFELSPGPRSVRVVQDELGFERTREIQLVAGRTHETEILGRRGWLELQVAPWARVTIDGKPRGLTPLPPLALYEGLHQVVLENPDLGAVRRLTVRVVAEETERVEVVLQKPEGS